MPTVRLTAHQYASTWLCTCWWPACCKGSVPGTKTKPCARLRIDHCMIAVIQRLHRRRRLMGVVGKYYLLALSAVHNRKYCQASGGCQRQHRMQSASFFFHSASLKLILWLALTLTFTLNLKLESLGTAGCLTQYLDRADRADSANVHLYNVVPVFTHTVS